MDLETFHLQRSNTVPQTTPEIIDLDTYRLSGKRAISDVINLSDEDDDDDDEIKILNFIPKTTHFGKRKRIEKGESSNSRDTPFVCEICTDTKTIKDAFYITGCSHAYCSDCVAMYIGSKLDDNITNIGCPVPGCSGLLEPVFCRSILTPEVFEQWGKALCEALIDVSEKFYCPFPDCSALLINDGTEAVGNTKCPHCNRMFCAQCKVPWHNGMACTEFQKLHADEMGKDYDMLVKLAKRRSWKRCPKCRVYVARNKGCSHMTCRCGCNFCYKCGSGYLRGACECHKVKPINPPIPQYQQIPSTVLTRGVPIGGSGIFPFPQGYLTNMSQTQGQIPSNVSTTGVFASRNFLSSNPLSSYQPQGQIFSGISGGVSTSGTFPHGYPINSVQRQEHIFNAAAAAYAVQRQKQIPSTVSTTGPLPYRYGTYPPIIGGVSAAGTLSNRYTIIPAQPQVNILNGVVYPTMRQE